MATAELLERYFQIPWYKIYSTQEFMDRCESERRLETSKPRIDELKELGWCQPGGPWIPYFG